MNGGWGYVGRESQPGGRKYRLGSSPYHQVVQRVERAVQRLGDQAHLRRLVELPEGPLLQVNLSLGASQKLLVLAGTHGDEPAGVEAAVELLEHLPRPWLESLSLTVIPCLNPGGFARGWRGDRHQRDLNWSYDRPDLPEIAALRGLVRGQQFDAVVDFHEDWESPGFYLYELSRRSQPLGEAVIREVATRLPIHEDDIIEGARARGGIIRPYGRPDSATCGEGIPVRLFARHTDHYLTTETPQSAPLHRRSAAHLAALGCVVQAHAPALSTGATTHGSGTIQAAASG